MIGGAGIITGYDNGSFRPDAQIARVETAVMIARAMQLLTVGGASTGFADDADIPRYHMLSHMDVGKRLVATRNRRYLF